MTVFWMVPAMIEMIATRKPPHTRPPVTTAASELASIVVAIMAASLLAVPLVARVHELLALLRRHRSLGDVRRDLAPAPLTPAGLHHRLDRARHDARDGDAPHDRPEHVLAHQFHQVRRRAVCQNVHFRPSPRPR